MYGSVLFHSLKRTTLKRLTLKEEVTRHLQWRQFPGRALRMFLKATLAHSAGSSEMATPTATGHGALF